MGQELLIPQAFQGKGMSPTFAAALNATDDNLAAGIGQSYGVIGYKGKVWSGRYRGERKNFLRPDDGTPAAYLDVIILGQAQSKSKSFYKKYDANTSDGDRPICSSIDGLTPDPDVTAKQCDSCALCPRNVWKTDPQTGRKGRECTDYKRLAVLVLPTQSKPTFGQAIMEAMFLRVPPDSLNSLAIMGETMSSQGHHYASYITRITFDPQKAHPCMVFRPLQPLTDSEAGIILELRGDPIVNRITGGDLTSDGPKPVASMPPTVAAGLVAPATLTPSTPVQPALAIQTQQPAQTPTEPLAGLSSGLGGNTTQASLSPPAVAAQPATPSPTTSATASSTSDTGLAPTGLGGASTVSASPSLVPDVGQSGLTVAAASDAGAPEESDAEMDARIAALIAPK